MTRVGRLVFQPRPRWDGQWVRGWAGLPLPSRAPCPAHVREPLKGSGVGGVLRKWNLHLAWIWEDLCTWLMKGTAEIL